MCDVPGMVVDADDAKEGVSVGDGHLRPAGYEANRPPKLVRSESWAAPISRTMSTQASDMSRGASSAFLSQSDEASISMASRSDLDFWKHRDETLIIFDWDDTLCPTTYRHRCAGGAQRDAEGLLKHAQAVEHVLQVAAGLGHVCIVSMAHSGWIEQTTQELMPSVARTLEVLNIPISLARVGVSPTIMRHSGVDARSPSHFLKRRTIAKVVRNFYASHLGRRVGAKNAAARGRSWKNLVGVGDCVDERLALQDIVMGRIQRDRTGRWKECRCKTVKLWDFPSLAELTKQLHSIAKLLPALVHHDGDVHYDVADGDFTLA